MPTAMLERPKPNSIPPAKKARGDEPLFEVVNGQIVDLPHLSAYSGNIANEICIEIAIYARQHGLGKALSEILFSIPTKEDPDNQRRPDVAYLSLERWPANRQVPDSDPWPVVPNLTVEVLSPNDRIREVHTKIQEYFDAGVELVWVVDPHLENASVYTSPTQVTIITREGTLEGSSVIPGFTLPMAKLFSQ